MGDMLLLANDPLGSATASEPNSALAHDAAVPRAHATDGELLDAYSNAIVGAVESVGPAVVHLEITAARRDRRGRTTREEAAGSGSGFFFTPDGARGLFA